MVIPAKHSRPITVDGVGYRWRIRRRPTYRQGIGQGPLTVAVERSDSRGQLLLVRFPFDRPDSWIAPRPVAVTPAMVADAIRTSLDRGWDPHRPAGVFRLDIPAS